MKVIINCFKDKVVFNHVETIELSPEDEYTIQLRNIVTTGYTWIYTFENNNPTNTVNIIHEDENKDTKTDENLKKGDFIIGGSSVLNLSFKSKKSDTIKFYQIREWLKQKLEDLEPNFILKIIIKE